MLVEMPRGRTAYPPEYRQKPVEPAEAGRSPAQLAKEFEPSAQAIRNWIKRTQADGGRRRALLNSVERVYAYRDMHRETGVPLREHSCGK